MGWTTLSPAAKSRVAGPNFYTRVLPIGVFMATSISLGNAAYLFLGVSCKEEQPGKALVCV